MKSHSNLKRKAFCCSEQCLALQLKRMKAQPRHQLLHMMFLTPAAVSPHHTKTLHALPGMQTSWHFFPGPAGAGKSPVSTAIQSILSAINMRFLTNNSRHLLMLAILFHPWQLEGFQAALTTRGLDLFWEGRKTLGQTTDTSKPGQRAHRAQHPKSPQLPDPKLQPRNKAGGTCAVLRGSGCVSPRPHLLMVTTKP